jgi:hypothetical protein
MGRIVESFDTFNYNRTFSSLGYQPTTIPTDVSNGFSANWDVIFNKSDTVVYDTKDFPKITTYYFREIGIELLFKSGVFECIKDGFTLSQYYNPEEYVAKVGDIFEFVFQPKKYERVILRCKKLNSFGEIEDVLFDYGECILDWKYASNFDSYMKFINPI